VILQWVFTLASAASNFACINILPTTPIADVTSGTWSGRSSSCCTYICTNIYTAHVSVFELVYVGVYVYVHTLRSEALVVTGWRRLIGSPKLQIIFHKRAAKYMSLLRKMIYKDKGSYESWPPCSAPAYHCRKEMM